MIVGQPVDAVRRPLTGPLERHHVITPVGQNPPETEELLHERVEPAVRHHRPPTATDRGQPQRRQEPIPVRHQTTFESLVRETPVERVHETLVQDGLVRVRRIGPELRRTERERRVAPAALTHGVLRQPGEHRLVIGHPTNPTTSRLEILQPRIPQRIPPVQLIVHEPDPTKTSEPHRQLNHATPLQSRGQHLEPSLGRPSAPPPRPHPSTPTRRNIRTSAVRAIGGVTVSAVQGEPARYVAVVGWSSRASDARLMIRRHRNVR